MTAATRGLVVAAVVGIGLLGSPGQVRAGEPDRVGRIIIEGNTDTWDSVILNELPFRPGQILKYPDLEKARTRLTKLGVFDKKNPPTVEVLPNELNSEFKDILIRVTERSGGFAQLVIRDGIAAVRHGDLIMMIETVGRVRSLRPGGVGR